ncbi:hypothetical protein PFICI_03807 [Pestalotiopsis fici W106-1]|uniref:Uncharacterized protein n=1 Tax=Pestalotiopsis fici (strain W106-1 / CGMCC3.15140) TaxID=1229662 RepID=W3XK00_PESFW|nr:uncharacterized protein PFICI_03807 [Pestalotiopsis fici W106-1]ETS85782.1 hypothetical protein PFICI_03807 [Pestalotiopsis fici W106-1]
MALKHFILVALAATATHAVPNAELGETDNKVLVARTCDYDVDCKSATGSGIEAGKYCGFCKQVRPNYVADHIYQINGKSGAKSCCDYGYSTACADRWKVVKPNVEVNCKNSGKGY